MSSSKAACIRKLNGIIKLANSLIETAEELGEWSFPEHTCPALIEYEEFYNMNWFRMAEYLAQLKGELEKLKEKIRSL